MPPTYRYDHMHVRSRDVKKTAEYYHRMFDARIVESIQSDGKPRTDLDLNGLTIFIAPVPAEARSRRRHGSVRRPGPLRPARREHGRGGGRAQAPGR